MAGPPEPKSEASSKQTSFANANGHAYMKRQEFVQYETVQLLKTFKTFTSVVKVALLTSLEELLIHNCTMCLILFLGHNYFGVLVKTHRY